MNLIKTFAVLAFRVKWREIFKDVLIIFKSLYVKKGPLNKLWVGKVFA